MNYFIRKSGIVSGPFPEEDIRRRLSLNLLTSMDEASADGRAWRRIRQTPLWMPPSAASISASSGMAAGRRQPAPTTPAALHLRREAKREMENAARFAPRPAPSTAFPTPQIHTSGLASPGRVPRAPSAPAPELRERRRFGNWWLALAIPCATIVVLAIIGAFVEDDSGNGNTPGWAENGNAASDGYRGEEIDPIDYTQIKPEFHDWFHYITPSYADVRQMLSMVLSSEHVAANELYEILTKDIRLYLLPQDDTVNAFAAPVDDYRKEPWPTMYVLGGYGRFSRVIGAVLAMENRDPSPENNRIDKLIEQLAAVIDEKDGKLSIVDADSILAACGGSYDLYSDDGFIADAKSASRGVLLSVIAHEVGHFALGHVHGKSPTLERSRNQEREADSFAHSVASGGADAENMFWGNFFGDLIFALAEDSGNHDLSRTHPYSKERLANLVRDNRSIASKYGIDEEVLRDQFRTDGH